jgi:hypothetical protein
VRVGRTVCGGVIGRILLGGRTAADHASGLCRGGGSSTLI